MRIRFTLVPGVNDDEDHLRRLAGFVSSLGLSEIDVLPYRTVVAGSYEALGRPNPAAASRSLIPTPSRRPFALFAECGVTAAVVRRSV